MTPDVDIADKEYLMGWLEKSQQYDENTAAAWMIPGVIAGFDKEGSGRTEDLLTFKNCVERIAARDDISTQEKSYWISTAAYNEAEEIMDDYMEAQRSFVDDFDHLEQQAEFLDSPEASANDRAYYASEQELKDAGVSSYSELMSQRRQQEQERLSAQLDTERIIVADTLQELSEQGIEINAAARGMIADAQLVGEGEKDRYPALRPEPVSTAFMDYPPVPAGAKFGQHNGTHPQAVPPTPVDALQAGLAPVSEEAEYVPFKERLISEIDQLHARGDALQVIERKVNLMLENETAPLMHIYEMDRSPDPMYEMDLARGVRYLKDDTVFRLEPDNELTIGRLSRWSNDFRNEMGTDIGTSQVIADGYQSAGVDFSRGVDPQLAAQRQQEPATTQQQKGSAVGQSGPSRLSASFGNVIAQLKYNETKNKNQDDQQAGHDDELEL